MNETARRQLIQDIRVQLTAIRSVQDVLVDALDVLTVERPALRLIQGGKIELKAKAT